MNNSVDGEIIKTHKLWWIKINSKPIRTSPLDGATFPYKIKVRYSVDNIVYEKSKFVYWKNEEINVGDKLIVIYNRKNPSKILNITKKIYNK